MWIVWPALFVFVAMLALIVVYFIGGGRFLQRGLRARLVSRAIAGGLRLPKATMIVPVTGDDPSMRACLSSLLNQDYPYYEIVFTVKDQKDPAYAAAQAIAAEYPHARVVTAGPALTCGQKNQNLLAGVRAADPESTMLVFCDGTHIAPVNFLGDLLKLLIKGKARFTTGYHRVIPQDDAFAVLGMLITVQGLHMLQGFPELTQPWGGAMAMKRDDFVDWGVAELWASNIVDDCSLGAHLARQNIRCKAHPGACLNTPLAGKRVRDWILWLTRQFMYLKFCWPGTWLLGFAPLFFINLPYFAILTFVFGWGWGYLAPEWLYAPLAYAALYSASSIPFAYIEGNKPPILKWLAVYWAAPLILFWCYLRTWKTNVLSWRGVDYSVAWGGKVVEILRREGAKNE